MFIGFTNMWQRALLVTGVIGGSKGVVTMNFGEALQAVKIPILITLSLLLITPANAQITRDKYMHVSASAAAGIVLAQNKPFCKWKPWQRALFNVVVIGGGKEWYDARHPDKHSADFGDIAADAVGAVSAEGVVWLYHKTW